MMDPRKIGQFLMGEWDKTSQPLKERGIPGQEFNPDGGLAAYFSPYAIADVLAPVGTYEDGRIGPAVPKALADLPQFSDFVTGIPGAAAGMVGGLVDSTKRLMDSDLAKTPINDDAAWDQMSRDAFDGAGLATTGALGVGLAGGMADDAVRAVRTYRGAASETIAPSTMENPGTVWSSTSPKVADFYAERAAGYADNDGLIMPLDVRGSYKTEGPSFGTQQWSPEWQAKIDAAASEGYDGVRFRNVSDSIDGVTSDWFATAKPGTIFSATTGKQLYSNAPTGSSVPLAVNAFERSAADLPATAAFKFGDEVLTGKYHGDAIWSAVEKYGNDAIKNLRKGDSEKAWNDREGFQTLGGDFISRKQAAENIRKSGLVPGENIPDDFHAALLNEYRAQGLWSNAPTGSSVPLAVNALERAQPQGIRAYHGSPHDFDRFSLDKIGTGEGAQAYGHGLYFADSEDVARSYRDKLEQPYYVAGSQKLERGTPQSEAALMLDTNGGDVAAAKRELASFYAPDDPHRLSLEAALNDLAPVGVATAGKGRMYEVNIKANPKDFLDFDAPISAQPAIAERLAPFGVPSDAKGHGLYNALADRLLAEGRLQPGQDLSVQVSKALKEAGIPGIKYLDGMSRQNVDVNELRGTLSMWERAARKSPNDAYAQQMLADAQKALADAEKPLSSNYVVTDDALIDILRKYANAPTASAIPLGIEGQEQEGKPALLEYLRAVGLM